MSSIINVSNRLPITLGKGIKKSSGGLISALDSIKQDYTLQWVGWTGGATPDDESKRAEITRRIREQFDFHPIFLNRREVSDYYNGFANASLWPLLHYMSTYSRYEKGWFETYRKVNEYFAKVVLTLATPEDLVWVHDYHLMLLPELLRRENPKLNIGFFLHTPFPSYELFRCHPDREALLKGVLGADLIGFHTYGYLRHFRSTALRVLGLESEVNCIAHDNQKTHVGVYPIGIDSDKFTQTLHSMEYQKYLMDYRETYRDRKVILGVERLDYTKGIPRRLDAIEQFLARSKRREDVVFILVAVPSRGEVREYRELLELVEGKVGRINGKYATVKNIPIHFMYRALSFSELCALYSLADVAMVTPLIDGMNLVAKEYIACQRDKEGVLILSEFAGAAQELFNAHIVNPYDIEQVSRSIEEALSMPPEEKRERSQPMRERVLQQDSRFWAESFILELAHKTNDQEEIVETRQAARETLRPFHKAKHIALFLDYDGTLCELKKKPEDAYPNGEIKTIFTLLAECNDIDVFIISGRQRRDMQLWFARFGFTLIAEHGYYYRRPQDDDWLCLDEKADLSWKEHIRQIFQHYTQSTPGSAVEEKTSSLVWHYRNADPEFGTWKANELMGELMELASNLPVEIHHGKKIVEVGSSQINKGQALEFFLQHNSYDAILCAGDDETDESMFRLDRPEIVSLKIGSGNTHAQYTLPHPAAFRKYLKSILQHKLQNS